MQKCKVVNNQAISQVIGGRPYECDIAHAAEGLDGIVFALSYILHHPFMHDMTQIAALMRRVRISTGNLPAWFLLQDANFPDRGGPGSIAEIWPEDRVRLLADLCEDFGYYVNPYKYSFCAPRVDITRDARFPTQGAGDTQNACRFFDRIGVR